MDNNHNEEREQPRLSRTQYRQQQREEQRRRGKLKMDESSFDMSNDEKEISDNTIQDEPFFSREETASERHEQSAVEKTAQLKKRLNIAIVALLVAIIIVYLILFFVG